MTPEARKTADDYYAGSGSWAVERTDLLRSSRRTAWIVAIIAAVIALAEAVALMLLTPLKTVVPYTLLVDRQTGFVQALNPIEPNRIAPDSALTQSFLVQYVIAREGFDIATIQSDYRKVSLWSADSARGDYVSSMQVTNPDSPLTRLPRSTAIETRVRSVSSLGRNTALVRFETSRRDRGQALQPSQHWVAVIDYRYANTPMAVEDRFINPLGFQVTRYRRNPETLPTEVPATPAVTTGAAQAAPPAAAAPTSTPVPAAGQGQPAQ